ncbi:hypothetical protein PRZ48_008800 [Zasmidium cellare]|uniref:F-box domain-containing protein n=1 Tax=Zasmidium cellare TaxID=395010 RepID=A0ABR0EGH8_ZASCE|nr:hypothetical protein PRZ48_008800 [Zasmidium cellare]
MPTTPFKVDVIKAPSMATSFNSTQSHCYLLDLPDELLLWILGYAITKELEEHQPHDSSKSRRRRGLVDVEDDGLQRYRKHVQKEAHRFILSKKLYDVAKDAIRDSMKTGTLSVSVRQEEMRTQYTTLRLTGTLYHPLSYNHLTKLHLIINTGFLAMFKSIAKYHFANASAGIIALLRQYTKLKELIVRLGRDISEEGRVVYRKALQEFASAGNDPNAPVIALSFLADESSNADGKV